MPCGGKVSKLQFKIWVGVVLLILLPPLAAWLYVVR